MSRWRADDDNALLNGGGLAMLAAGLLAGLAAGAYLAHRLGGLSGLSHRVRGRWSRATARPSRRRGHGAADSDYDEADVEETASVAFGAEFGDEYDAGADTWDDGDEAVDYEEDERYTVEGGEADTMSEDESEDADEFASADPGLEDRVLEAFMNDPVLKDRAVDIGAITPGTIELTGTVYTDDEYDHATTLARGVPGVETVVNRLVVEEEEAAEDAAAARYRAGDARYTESRWESDIVGTGRPRQGTSQDPGRHADPKVPLETRASEAQALREAADEPDDTDTRRRRGSTPGDRAGRNPTAPGGVPKADHVANPDSPSR